MDKQYIPYSNLEYDLIAFVLLKNNNFEILLFHSRFQSLNLTHVPEHSHQIYEFR